MLKYILFSEPARQAHYHSYTFSQLCSKKIASLCSIFSTSPLIINHSKVKVLRSSSSRGTEEYLAKRNNDSSAEFRAALQDLLTETRSDSKEKHAMNIKVDKGLYLSFQRACGKKSVTQVVSSLMRFFLRISHQMS